jgi:hypothetical protein
MCRNGNYRERCSVSTLNIEDFGDLQDYLCAQDHIRLSGEISVDRLPGRGSNRTVLIKLPREDPSF